MASAAAGRKRYLIDGYNVAHAIRRGPLRPDELLSARTGLVKLLKPLADRRTAVTIVFDSRLGAPETAPRGTTGVVETVYVRDADSAIVELARKWAGRESVIVVSRDRAVVGRATQLGATAMRIEDVLALAAARGGDGGEGAMDPLEPPEKYGLDEHPRPE